MGRVSKSQAQLEVGSMTGLGEDGNEEREMQKMRPGFSTLIVVTHFQCLVKSV
jgi:hypothetical protein